VHIDGLEWTYKVGRSFVSIRDPEGKRMVVNRSCITPCNPESGRFEHYLTPQIVKDYIWMKLHPVRKLTMPVGTADAKDMLINLFCGSKKQFAGAQE
jgi:hypothetical protein